MALTVEDGTGVTGADCYADVTACSAYAVAYYGSALDGSPASKEAAIGRATAYLDGLRWKGTRTYGRLQSLQWPRSGVSDCEGEAIADDEIPDEVIIAQHELARAEHQSPGILSPQGSLRDSIVQREKVDVIEVAYDTSRLSASTENAQVLVDAARRRIRCFLIAGGATVRQTAMVVA